MTSETALSQNNLDDRRDMRPILRSFVVLRKERFGGFLFNHYMPPHIQLDHITYDIAAWCDGSRTLRDIRNLLMDTYDHSAEYLDMVLDRAMDTLQRAFAVYWREEAPVTIRSVASGARHPVGKNVFNLSAPIFVIWEITTACNLSCKHCLSGCGPRHDDEIPTKTAKRIIDMLADMNVFTVNFSGGEPMIRPDIFEILSYASQKRMAIELLTNGTLITPQLAHALYGTRLVNVQVSLDGARSSHDAFRGIPGAYDKAVAGILALKEAGLNVAVSMTVHKQNIDEMSDLVDRAVDYGASVFKTTLFMPTGRGKQHEEALILTPRDVERFTHLINEKKASVGDAIRIITEDLYPWLLTDDSGPEDDGRTVENFGKTFGCTAGNSSFYITANGRVAPCPFLQRFVAGDLTTSSAEEIWASSPVFDLFRNITAGKLKGRCGTCHHLGADCFGGCRAAAYAYTNDIFAEDPMCWHRRGPFEPIR